MIDDWFSVIRLPMSLRLYRRLPRNPAYRYEYTRRKAWLTPRPQRYHALLDLDVAPMPGDPGEERIAVRPLLASDWSELPRVFAGAFGAVQPFQSLDEPARADAARACLDYTRSGGDGPLAGPACFVAHRAGQPGEILGGILITLIAEGDLEDSWEMPWPGPPPPDCLERRLGQPHLTWVFVSRLQAGRGAGTALLASAAAALRELGYRTLASTFLIGNDSSILWHWRTGFRLLAHPGSWRTLRRRWRGSHDAEPGGVP